MTVTHPAVRRPRAALPTTLAIVALLAAACGTPAGGPTGSPGATAPGATAPAATPAPSVGTIDSPEAAVDAIRARVPLFDGFRRRDPDLVGQASSWTAEPSSVGWHVVIETGWGDCEAGCIDRHTWTWDVAPDGTLTWVGEAGSPLGEAQLAALEAASTRTGVAGRATGGPTCPVERPGDPACAGKLVGGVALVIKDGGGGQVASVTTDGSGYYRLALAPGDYALEPPAVPGFMSGPPATPFTVADGAETWLDLSWDTGIR